MNIRFCRHVNRSIAMLVAVLIGSTLALAEPPAGTLSETLQKAIYTEETVGDLDAAIKLYEQVVADGNAVRSVAAQAQYRLGLALLKQGKKADATAAFEKLIKDYPQEEELVAKARKQLPTAIELKPAPWNDGEVLQLDMKWTTGFDVGTCLYQVAGEKADGKEMWRCTTRQFVSIANMQSYSTVLADRDTFAPRSSLWLQTLLGDVEATYKAGLVELKDLRKNTTREIKLKELPAFDNEQAAQLIRRLPLAEGYKTTLHIVPTLTGGTGLDLELEVEGKELVKTPAGEFDCFRIHLSIVDQTFFYSADEHRYMVGFDANGVSARLSGIHQLEPGKLHRYQAEQFSLELPSDWFGYTAAPLKPKELPTVCLVDMKNTITPTIRVSRRADKEELKSLDAWYESDVAISQKEMKGFTVRPESRQPITVAGTAGMSYVADFTEGKKKQVSYAVELLGEQSAIRIRVVTEPDQFDAYRAALDKVIASFQWKP